VTTLRLPQQNSHPALAGMLDSESAYSLLGNRELEENPSRK